MRRFLILILLVLVSMCLSTVADAQIQPSETDEEILFYLDENAEYPGGMDAMFKIYSY